MRIDKNNPYRVQPVRPTAPTHNDKKKTPQERVDEAKRFSDLIEKKDK